VCSIVVDIPVDSLISFFVFNLWGNVPSFSVVLLLLCVIVDIVGESVVFVDCLHESKFIRKQAMPFCPSRSTAGSIELGHNRMRLQSRTARADRAINRIRLCVRETSVGRSVRCVVYAGEDCAVAERRPSRGSQY